MDGKKDWQKFTEYGKCIYCGKEIAWCNYKDTTRLTILKDSETGKDIMTIEEPLTPYNEEESFLYSDIPEEMTSLKNWVGWKIEERNGKNTKIPYSSTGVHASSTDPQTWRRFEDVSAIQPTDKKGIGFVFDGKGIVGIDIDHCIVDGVIDEKYNSIIKAFTPTYMEVSPSGTGIHIYIKCETAPYPAGKHGANVEVYSSGRYFTVTGKKLKTSRNIINVYQAEMVRGILDPFLPAEPPARVTPIISNSPTSLSDYDIVRIASGAKNASKFNALMRGSTSDYGGDRSDADMALASILAFYTDDENQIERIMRTSGLVRDKWNRVDYLRDRTIHKAVASCTEHFKPNNDGDVDEGKSIAANFLIAKNNVKKDPFEPQPKDSRFRDSTQKLTWVDNYDDSVQHVSSKEIITLAGGNGTKWLGEFPELPDGFFKDYMTFGSRVSYSTKEYHFAALLPILSVIIGRRAVCKIGLMNLYPNVFSLIVGPTSISGKSFACDMAVNTITPILEYGVGLNEKEKVNIKYKTVSEAALVQDLSATPNIFWYYDDCRPFFEDAISKWNASILGTLCSIYDCSKVERSLSRHNKKEGEISKYECENPFVSLLFNTTTTDMEAVLSSRLFSSGFFPRLMVFLGRGEIMRENVDLTLEELEQLKKITRYVNTLNEKYRYLNPDSIVFGVSKKIERWKIEATNRHLGLDEDDMRAAIARGFIHAYKIAILYTLFNDGVKKELPENKEEYPIVFDIPDKYAELAINIVETYLIPRAMYLYKLGNTCDFKNYQEQILKAIEKNGGQITKTQLGRTVRINRAARESAIAALVDSESIEVFEEQTSETGKKPITVLKLYKQP